MEDFVVLKMETQKASETSTKKPPDIKVFDWLETGERVYFIETITTCKNSPILE